MRASCRRTASASGSDPGIFRRYSCSQRRARVSNPFQTPFALPYPAVSLILVPMRITGTARAFGNRLRIALGLIFVCATSCAQVTAPAILELDVENIVSYSSDIFDASKFATDANLTTAVTARNFGFVMAVGDIGAINGKPAKGSLIARQQAIILNSNPTPGQGMADTVRTAVTEFLFEIQQADGSPVGSIHTLTASGGSAPVGLSAGASPLGVPLNSNHVVVGGSGAFVGVRGQGASAVLPGNTGPRVASMTEDP